MRVIVFCFVFTGFAGTSLIADSNNDLQNMAVFLGPSLLPDIAAGRAEFEWAFREKMSMVVPLHIKYFDYASIFQTYIAEEHAINQRLPIFGFRLPYLLDFVHLMVTTGVGVKFYVVGQALNGNGMYIKVLAGLGYEEFLNRENNTTARGFVVTPRGTLGYSYFAKFGLGFSIEMGAEYVARTNLPEPDRMIPYVITGFNGFLPELNLLLAYAW